MQSAHNAKRQLATRGDLPSPPSSPPISDEGGKAIGEGLGKSATLQTLDLSYNEIGAEGGKAIGEGLGKSATLQTLDLSYNEMGAEGGKAIGEGLGKSATLQTLNLSENEIGDEEKAAPPLRPRRAPRTPGRGAEDRTQGARRSGRGSGRAPPCRR